MAVVLVSVSSCAQSTLRINENTDLKKIERELINHFQEIDILKNVKEMNSFALDKAENGILLVTGEGIEIKDDVTWKVSFRVAVVDSSLTAMAESCSGNNCEKCKFASKGGCDCERHGSITGGAVYCNHTITKGFAELISR